MACINTDCDYRYIKDEQHLNTVCVLKSKWNYLLTAEDHLDSKLIVVDSMQPCLRLQEHKCTDDPINVTELVTL